MIAVRIGPDLSMACVASPAYFLTHPPPETPQNLVEHDCINQRHLTSGGFYAWEFEKDGRELRVRVEGQLAFNSHSLVLTAALAGRGLGFVMEDVAAPHIAAGRLRRVLGDWCPPFPGYQLYYPSRRQSSPAFVALLEALRHRG